MMWPFYYTLVILMQSSACLANDYMVLYTGSPVTFVPVPPPDVDTDEKGISWYKAMYQSPMSSYRIAHASELAYAASAISDFIATGTYELPLHVTASGEPDTPFPFVTEVPAWFSELPADVKSIKAQEGEDMMSILVSVFSTPKSTQMSRGDENHGAQNAAAAREGFTVVTIIAGVAAAAVIAL